ncbi:hydrogenase nickel incorporation protein HypA [Alteribacter lacisalsi]|uniref:Hydrogenase maturation factor HypA n=1 Tax=Alteribacter lacisalsi TaxID=2045244 RepID=A0A2W0HUY0_9BACI|nr:hydrogenase maturation nickel metallochaperone HypA [Alteribacter lacisalsi]PYZ97478.1 hydrogenase nickel incorporation protein HypA [Alteribacter lacisalsi]
MHEWGLMQEIIRIVSEEAALSGIVEVTEIEIIAGEWCNVLPDALALAFDCIREEIRSGVITKSTVLVLRIEPALAKCRQCGHTFTPDYRLALCPSCGLAVAALISGETFRVNSFEGRDFNEN